ncbi:2-succinyl-5-enolpyruvyl-6-hydroxy-3-cyclohexene-1-carboxylic-acid synthase [Cochleicola gelatinilyticus]|uniref:2-succinyl-5-enolpyruvyl-6-hydroxy-3-cyclohexene-1-carboxylate synthase n=1 Tax=Cochleicola gelatinilyticus TaxID=1763537 RepID=A0A167HPW8_9FLAO|nr:2-succinyl-5-enolpyruvyl-6-hydroxy-3-cyclohexene-1-carboxylic-acid synthase [Cochleicola gelatinilyticus]OAB78840.1 2-succinyl-5-enolpyruvyl-6-hydroxy-3-cyclohexene-1-carboxylate synthase [Cochleicola gelatinilyticus]
MTFSNKVLSQTITQLCLIKEIDHIVISPGSRNAPLTIGFTEHPEFKNFSIIDERCAAFFAMGMAQQLKRPVALVCTSGSALLNYYPAIAEAFYSNIPLVVISADRPQHLIDIGDGQTIRQENVYANHILYSANCMEGTEHQIKNETEINIALNTAIELKGPVHINVPFSEPLYHTTTELSVRPQHVPARLEKNTIDLLETKLLDTWNAANRIIVLIGVLDPESIDEDSLEKLAKDPRVIVFTETTSNVYHENFFPAIDQLIAPLNNTDFERLQPDLLLTFGGMVVSKKIKAFLRTYKPNKHWHVDIKRAFDTYFSLTEHIKLNPGDFLKAFLPKDIQHTSTYFKTWEQVKIHRLKKHETYLNSIPFSDLKVFSEIVKRLPDAIQLQLSNSATIRYAQLFSIKPSIKVFCNRGTSGIDGSTSTAVGAAFIASEQTVFITGDLSFLYDSNGLWNAYIPKHFRIILINNGGGGIFRILPGAKKVSQFDTFFETKHNFSAKHLCEMYDFRYEHVNSLESLQKSLATFFDASDVPKLLEIDTSKQNNDEILVTYFSEVR